jgi:uncharacterized protein
MWTGLHNAACQQPVRHPRPLHCNSSKSQMRSTNLRLTSEPGKALTHPNLNEALNRGDLDQADIDRLSNHLDAMGPPALSLEAVDGLFAALICGPDMVMFSEYLPVVFGGAPEFGSNEAATEVLGLLLRHWNAVADELLLTLKAPDGYSPLLQTRGDGNVQGNDWACGFMRGVGMRQRSWQPLIAGGEHSGVLLPMVILKHEAGSKMGLV